jgi:dihydrofolate synthase/folylpolyglutamate synthase
LYTSPHLNRLEERICIDGAMCTAAELVELVDVLRSAADEMDRHASHTGDDHERTTYFEIVTAMAMLHFQRKNVDHAVLEVGLGGRLDSTNVCNPKVTVITSISLDHTKQLGNTLASIAREKAGIVKPQVPLVNGVRNGVGRQVIEEVAAERGSPSVILGVDFDFEYHPQPSRCGALADATVTTARTALAGHIDYLPSNRSLGAPLFDMRLGMFGQHQAANAAITTSTIRLLAKDQMQASESAIRAGIAGAQCPARTELISTNPTVMLDGAHNEASIGALLSVLDESFGGRPRIIVFGSTRGKDIRGMLSLIGDSCEHLLFTQYHHNPRSYPVEQLVEVFSELSVANGNKHPRVQVRPDPHDAWRAACNIATTDHVICITGSFFLAAELRPIILSQKLA